MHVKPRKLRICLKIISKSSILRHLWYFLRCLPSKLAHNPRHCRPPGIFIKASITLCMLNRRNYAFVCRSFQKSINYKSLEIKRSANSGVLEQTEHEVAEVYSKQQNLAHLLLLFFLTTVAAGCGWAY